MYRKSPMNVGYLISGQCTNLLGLYISELYRYKLQAGEFVFPPSNVTVWPVYGPWSQSVWIVLGPVNEQLPLNHQPIYGLGLSSGSGSCSTADAQSWCFPWCLPKGQRSKCCRSKSSCCEVRGACRDSGGLVGRGLVPVRGLLGKYLGHLLRELLRSLCFRRAESSRNNWVVQRLFLVHKVTS